jgi:hypothetical protein
MGEMQSWKPDSAYVVVVVHGPRDISRTTWPDAAQAKRHIERLRGQGFSADDIRLYHARVVTPPSPDLWVAR